VAAVDAGLPGGRPAHGVGALLRRSPSSKPAGAITSFALSASGKCKPIPIARLRRRNANHPYALAELDAERQTWRRVLSQRTFPRGALLAGWNGPDLWLWNRPARRLERMKACSPEPGLERSLDREGAVDIGIGALFHSRLPSLLKTDSPVAVRRGLLWKYASKSARSERWLRRRTAGKLAAV